MSSDRIYGKSQLMAAAQGGHLDAVKYLIEEKVIDVDKMDNRGVTALMFAAAEGHLDVVNYLIDEKRAGCAIQDHQGKTAYGLVVERECGLIAEYLETISEQSEQDDS